MRAELAEIEGVAVGRRAHHAADADAAAGAADVLDDHRLAERLPQPIVQDARDGVGRAAGRERHDHGDRPRRIGLRERGVAAGERCGEQAPAIVAIALVIIPVIPP